MRLFSRRLLKAFIIGVDIIDKRKYIKESQIDTGG